MPRRMLLRITLMLLPAAVAAWASEGSMPLPSPAVIAEHEARRFPQPVRAGDLVGRKLLAPQENQPVLGRVVGVVRSSDGETRVVIAQGGWFGIGARLVAIPIGTVALLGEYLASVEIKPDQWAELPTFDPTTAKPVGPDEQIRVGIVKPFH